MCLRNTETQSNNDSEEGRIKNIRQLCRWSYYSFGCGSATEKKSGGGGGASSSIYVSYSILSDNHSNFNPVFRWGFSLIGILREKSSGNVVKEKTNSAAKGSSD